MTKLQDTLNTTVLQTCKLIEMNLPNFIQVFYKKVLLSKNQSSRNAID